MRRPEAGAEREVRERRVRELLTFRDTIVLDAELRFYPKRIQKIKREVK